MEKNAKIYVAGMGVIIELTKKKPDKSTFLAAQVTTLN